jgi:hypothetical protein
MHSFWMVQQVAYMWDAAIKQPTVDFRIKYTTYR